MLLQRIRQVAADPESGFRSVDGVWDAAFLADELLGLAEADADVLEDGPRLRARAVGTPGGATGFDSFLDGIQRARISMYRGGVPIVYAYGAAVVRGRAHGDMYTAGNGVPLQIEREALVFPFRLVPRDEVGALFPGAELLDSGESQEPLPLFPPLLLARAGQRVNRWRESLESELALRWCASPTGDGWLLVDGGLTLHAALAAAPRVAGVIKSHRTRFFDGDDAHVLFGLEPGERSSIFRPGTRSFTPVDSWYLRLRSADGRDVLWGLVRVEVAGATATPALADEVSRWLLAETAPVALPDARWDRLLYAVHDCERYLRSRAPTLW